MWASVHICVEDGGFTDCNLQSWGRIYQAAAVEGDASGHGSYLWLDRKSDSTARSRGSTKCRLEQRRKVEIRRKIKKINRARARNLFSLTLSPRAAVSLHLISSWMLKAQPSRFESTDKLQGEERGLVDCCCRHTRAEYKKPLFSRRGCFYETSPLLEHTAHTKWSSSKGHLHNSSVRNDLLRFFFFFFTCVSIISFTSCRTPSKKNKVFVATWEDRYLFFFF